MNHARIFFIILSIIGGYLFLGGVYHLITGNGMRNWIYGIHLILIGMILVTVAIFFRKYLKSISDKKNSPVKRTDR